MMRDALEVWWEAYIAALNGFTQGDEVDRYRDRNDVLDTALISNDARTIAEAALEDYMRKRRGLFA